MGLGSFGKAVGKVTGSVGKVFGGKTGDIIGTGLGYYFGGGAGALIGLGASKGAKSMGIGASVNTAPAEEIIDRSAENAKKARARLLYTEGGILGSQLNTVEKSERNLFGN